MVDTPTTADQEGRPLVREVFLYLDETGDFDMSGKSKASAYFGLGQATFIGEHGMAMWEGARLRYQLESEGIQLPSGLHANVDRPAVRHRVFNLISKHRPRFDVTLLLKQNANARVRQRIAEDDVYLYQLAWFLHFKYQAEYVLRQTDKVFVVAATISSGKKKKAARAAVEDVCAQFPWLDITLCTWDSSTSWGLQVADYGLWTVQRRILKGHCDHYATVFPLLKTCFHPWERERQRPAISEKPEKRARGPLVADRPAATVPVTPPPVNPNYPSSLDDADDDLTPPESWWDNQPDPWASHEPNPWEVQRDPETDPWADHEADAAMLRADPFGPDDDEQTQIRRRERPF